MNAVEALEQLRADAQSLAAAFRDAGYELYAVGGSVRDALLGQSRRDRDDYEIDFTTNARPDETDEMVLTAAAVAAWIDDARATANDGALALSRGLVHELPGSFIR